MNRLPVVLAFQTASAFRRGFFFSCHGSEKLEVVLGIKQLDYLNLQKPQKPRGACECPGACLVLVSQLAHRSPVPHCSPGCTAEGGRFVPIRLALGCQLRGILDTPGTSHYLLGLVSSSSLWSKQRQNQEPPCSWPLVLERPNGGLIREHLATVL